MSASRPATCRECGKPLSTEELKYYHDQCEGCVVDEHERIEAWRKGADDPELDEMYSTPERLQ